MDSHQYEDKLYFSQKVLQRGDVGRLATMRGVTVSAVSQRYNPNLPTPCDFSGAADLIRNLKELGQDRADRALAYLNAIGHASTESIDLGQAVGEYEKEKAEFLNAVLCDDRRKKEEWDDVLAKERRVTAALQAEVLRKADQVSAGSDRQTAGLRRRA